MALNPKDTLTDLQAFFPMVGDILRRRYKMPWGTFFWAILCFIYVCSPIDILPDVMPLLGITDDGAFILLVLAMLHKDITAYRHSLQVTEDVIEAEVVENKTEKKDDLQQK